MTPKTVLHRTLLEYQAFPDFDEVATTTLPEGAVIVSVQAHNQAIHLWAEGDPDGPQVTRRFKVVGTGHPIRPDAKHLATTNCIGIIHHVYEIPPA